MLIAVDNAGRRGGARRQRVSFGVIEQLRCARPGRASSNSCTGWTKDINGPAPWWPRSARRCSRCRNSCRRETGKTYAALVSGAWPASRKVIRPGPAQDAGRCRRARHVRVVDDARMPTVGARSRSSPSSRPGQSSLLDVTIKTGRTHQIASTFASRGAPDRRRPKYGDFRAQSRAGARRALRRPALRAHVPARAAARVRASLQRAGDRPRGTVAVRIRVPAGRPPPAAAD